MREACFCGRTGEIEEREPVYLDGGKLALRCAECGHLDRIEWLPEEVRAIVFEAAVARTERHKSPTAA